MSQLLFSAKSKISFSSNVFNCTYLIIFSFIEFINGCFSIEPTITQNLGEWLNKISTTVSISLPSAFVFTLSNTIYIFFLRSVFDSSSSIYCANVTSLVATVFSICSTIEAFP